MQSESCHVSTFKFPISVSILNQIRITRQTPSKACEIFPLLRFRKNKRWPISVSSLDGVATIVALERITELQ